VLKKLKRVGTLVAYVNAFSVFWKRLSALDPKKTLSRFPTSLLGPRFGGTDAGPMMEDLIGKSQDASSSRVNGQRVLRDVSAVLAVADLPQVF